jgi:hypothetical protein
MNTTEENEPANSRFRNHFTKESIKGHFQRNGKLYIGLGAGALAVVMLTNRDSVRVYVLGHHNTVTTILERRGHPGFMVRCKETGEVWASQNRAAACMNISESELSKHLNGLTNHVKGKTFERLGEAK